MIMGTHVTRTELRVRYHECDQQGVVFNAHYLAYADMACFDLTNRLYGHYDKLKESGYDWMVAESNLKFLGACRFDDALAVDAFVQHVGNTSFTLRFDISREGTKTTEITTRYVWVDSAQFTKVQPPAELRDALTAHL
ncbi:acyl-CoA thioesterase [Pseudonocardiaceae bacterium YIM PH 21723]|nr:acyl-CoA thioesterase [Pseudonocardiaceae bacterium YIM PH 21723]